MRLAPRTPSVVRLLPGSMAELKEASHRPKIIAPIVRANPYQNGGSLLRNDWRRFHGQITRNGINRFPNLDLGTTAGPVSAASRPYRLQS